MKSSSIVVALDIGTTKICTLVAEVEENLEFSVIGIGVAPSRGLKKGVIVDIELTTQSIRQSVNDAARMADVVIDYVFAGVSGHHISSQNARGFAAVGNEGRDITDSDVQRAIEMAKAVTLPPNREIIHVLPRTYTVDEQNGIRDPKGMSGVRLEVDVHIVMGGITWVQNLIKSCHRAGLEVAAVVLQPIASALAVLSADEKELGVALVDIGGGTTDVAVFTHGAIQHTSVLPVGGMQITSDIAIGLRTPMDAAEALKIREGSALLDLVDSSRTIEIPNTGGDGLRSNPVKNLCEIVEARTEEIFNMVKKEIQKSGSYDQLPAGVVLTGGTSLMRGAKAMAERILGLPVRIGKPLGVKGLAEKVDSPVFATSVGLIHHALDEQFDVGPGSHHGAGTSMHSGHGATFFESVSNRVKGWFKNLF